MDVLYFLKQRTRFLQQFYGTASSAFVERKRKIENGEEPYIPPYSEDGEPPFLEEWLEADESLNVLGYSCVSMLSAALHLFLKTWQAEIGLEISEEQKKLFKNKGWLRGYKRLFSENLKIDWERSGLNQALLEEITLARNRIQHPQWISHVKVEYVPSDLRNLRHMFFVDERERQLFAKFDRLKISRLIPTSVHIDSVQLATAIDEVEKFCEWLNEELENKLGYQKPA